MNVGVHARVVNSKTSTHSLDDPDIRLNLFPFTLTRPVSAIRVGILTIAEKWETCLHAKAFFKTEAYLQAKFLLSPKNNENLSDILLHLRFFLA